jgi:hypothetical protein
LAKPGAESIREGRCIARRLSSPQANSIAA